MFEHVLFFIVKTLDAPNSSDITKTTTLQTEYWVFNDAPKVPNGSDSPTIRALPKQQSFKRSIGYSMMPQKFKVIPKQFGYHQNNKPSKGVFGIQ